MSSSKQDLDKRLADKMYHDLEEALVKEREIQKNLAKYIREIDARKLWAKAGYSSLHAFCEWKYKIQPEALDELLKLNDDRTDRILR